MKTILSIFHIFRTSEKGAVLPLVGLAFGVLVLASGFTIDYTRAQIVKERMQWAVDAAALAGAKVADQGIDAVNREANDYFRANFPEGYMGTRGGEIRASEIPTVSGKGHGVRFEVSSMTMENYLSGAIGFSDINVSAAAEVNTLPITPMDIVFSIDLSGSMMLMEGRGCRYLPYGSNCFSGSPLTNSKLSRAKQAMLDFVDELHMGDDNVRFGLVGWTSYVNIVGAISGNYTVTQCPDNNSVALVASTNAAAVGQGNAGAPWMYGAPCREFSVGTIPDSGSLRPMRYLTASKSVIDSSIGGLRADGNTDGGLGMYWAYAMLNEPNKGWTGPPSTAMNKSIILLTDGENTKHFRTPDFADGSKYSDAANAEQRTWCQAARDAKINVYTIAYDIPSDDAIRTKAKTLLKDCASTVCPTNPGGVCYFDAANPGDLTKAMERIATTMMTMRLTR